ncbi:Mrs2p NDAI_0E03820 [Naumovozyma dairenensis CBS 421]|uniref:Magnesium transporter n=1 Tax=Naumovozyma dairenensis (strain ATCC 10597 / BCRC 20456 / CBS 421 / NBRC 0211 / NRRL Y-12639) TaxID=1071378 RepID=G0WBS9_NAUDC|nr:hypothetical protein NDAI_0E03820 [Naumovozyma dairenensis CBS 421]CCD25199.1 hypothetical protein NDAI_0E03820 [Naumovozyma dairenensis CBS 421]
MFLKAGLTLLRHPPTYSTQFRPLLRVTNSTFTYSKRFQSNTTLQVPLIYKQLLSLKPITPNDSYISCTVFNEKGDVVAVSQKFQKWAFLRDHKLYPRDLRKIDTTQVDIIPSILVKPNCFLINMLHIKALIEKDKIFIFDTSNPSAAVKLGVLMYDLESKLSSTSVSPTLKSMGGTQLYEHKALESILINVMSTLETEFHFHHDLCSHILNELENEVNREKLRDLLIKSKKLSLFYQKSLLVRQVLDELLESDEDLASMYLSVHRTEDDDFADLEMLLETYYTQCDEYVQQAASLIQDIKSTEEIVNIILDANRNSLMLLELKVTIYTLGFTVATLLPAFYGMNLKNFIEESYLGFGAVVFLSIVSAFMVTGSNFKALRSVTKLTMLDNNTSNVTKLPSVEVLQETKSQMTKEGTSQLWARSIQRLRQIWLGTNGMNSVSHRKWTKEDRDLVWKWLTDDPKD